MFRISAAINQVIDRKADAAMTRTDQRPLLKESYAFHASFALVIGTSGALIYSLYKHINNDINSCSLIGYAFVYLYLKRATPQNIVLVV